MVILQRTSKQEHSCPFQGINFTQIADNQHIRVRSTRFEKAPPIKNPASSTGSILSGEGGIQPPGARCAHAPISRHAKSL